MITVISGTNRPASRTLLVAEALAAAIRRAGEEARVLDLAKLDFDHFSEGMYAGGTITPALRAIQEQYVLDVQKLAFVLPEYNGSFPGFLKLFIDGISVNEYNRNFRGKTISLTGVASGRAGNLRGLDHLAACLNYLGGWVLPNKLPLSSVEGLLNAEGELTDKAALAALNEQALQLIAARNRNL